MTTKRTILVSFIVVLAVLPFVVRHYRTEAVREIVTARPGYIPPDYIPIIEILPEHERRIKERVELLKKQSLDETFSGLLETQQYHYPGFTGNSLLVPMDIQTVLSTRSFLKIFQQFGELPQEQATEKLHKFCEKAIKEFGNAIEDSLARNANPVLGTDYAAWTVLSHNGKVSKYMACTSMLLAARVGAHQLLLNQISEMRSIVDSYTERVKAYRPSDHVLNEAAWSDVARKTASLDDDCVLTVLMYALKRSNKELDIPFEKTFRIKTIPLCRWDSEQTYYDFEAQRKLKTLKPEDIVEQFAVYAFAEEDYFDDQKKKAVFDTLKECILM